LTCRTWFIRHLSRTLAQSAPAFLALLLPGDMSWLIFIPLLIVFGALYISVAFAWETRDHRLYKHGFAPEMVLPREDDDEP
ncbi:MAG: DUF5313 family protein, partial [Sciscionella sp.]|nr:DUF5313 family protein [Sciscionella sp.]